MNIHSAAPASKEENLISRIDFLRGIFSVWVLIAHTYGLATKDLAIETTGQWHEIFIHTFLLSGYYGVMGFFFLSGFCIQWSLQKKISSNLKSIDFTRYLKARFFRLAPLFLIGLFFAVSIHFLCQIAFSHHSGENIKYPTVELISSLFFMQGIFGSYPAYEPSWSITYEVIYYIAWPLALIATKFKPHKAFAFFATCAVFFTIVFYLLWAKYGDLPHLKLTALWGIPLASFLWITGALCRSYFSDITNHKIFHYLSEIKWPLLFLWILWTTLLRSHQLSLFYRTLLDPFSYVIIPLVILSDWKVSLPRNFISWIADLSYPLYLFHAPILYLISNLLIYQQSRVPWFVISITSGISAFLFSATAGVWMERYFLNIRKKL